MKGDEEAIPSSEKHEEIEKRHGKYLFI